MRILSKFKDYYDSALAFGEDASLIYSRIESIVPLNKLDMDWLESVKKKLPNIALHSEINGIRRVYSYDTISEAFIIGFCGRLYPCVHLKIEPLKEMYAYSYDEVISFLKKHKLHKTLKDFEEMDGWLWNSKSNLVDFFNLKVDDFQKFFLESKTPVFKIDFNGGKRQNEPRVTLNPQLSENSFVRVVDPFTAYQELSMYIGGVLGVSAPELVEISDKDLRDKKGFNNISFKKVPDLRKRKKKVGKIKKTTYKD